jgi:hypothetical protein
MAHDPERPGDKQGRPKDPGSEQGEVPEESKLGGSPSARLANHAILALSRAARSFLLYDPSNDAIRRFIQDLKDRMTRALQTAGSLDLEVRPFELLLHGEVVYLERDRERSLAFRMFRDGVRRLTISAGVDWDEILRLLEVLSVRYTGVRQNEDDIVTLLWKAGFQHIEIDAVEGFVPEDEELGDAQTRHSAAEVSAPADWDLPARSLGRRASLEWRAIDAAELQVLRDEEASQLLPSSATRAAAEMTALAAAPDDPTTHEEVLPFLSEVRDFLLAEGQLSHLTQLARSLSQAFADRPDRIQSLIATFGDKRALLKILHSTPKTTLAPPPELIELLDLLPAERLSHLIDLLGEERSEVGRRLTRQLIERYAAEQPDYVLNRLRAAEPGVACDLLRAMSKALPEQAMEAAIELAVHPDISVASEALRRFESAPSSIRVARTLMRMLGSPHEEIRLKVLSLLGARHDHAAFSPLLKYAEEHVAKGRSEAELTELGRALASLAPTAAETAFKDWLKPKGFMSRWRETASHRDLEWIAVSGLGTLPGAEIEKLIRDVSTKAGDEIRRHCLATLAQRRHKGTHDG